MKDTSVVYKPTIKRSLSEQWDYLYPHTRISYTHQKSQALRILSAVSAFIKLFEALFWLSLLLEATHNEEDKSTATLTVVLGTAFVVTLITGLVGMFGPCFHGTQQYKFLAVTTTASLLWDIIILALCFILDYYKHSGNKDNQTETAFNATIGLITAGATLVITNKLLVREKQYKHWTQTRTKPRPSTSV